MTAGTHSTSFHENNVNSTLQFPQKILNEILLATKLRHSLTYSASENILKLLNVMSDKNYTFTSKYFLKKIIQTYSNYLSIHHNVVILSAVHI